MSLQREDKAGFVPLYNVRTDLALEAHELVQSQTAEEIPGVISENLHEDGIAINRIQVETDRAAQQLGKNRGSYLTLEVPGLRRKDTGLQDRVTEILARELLNFLDLPSDLNQAVLVVGLGNWNVTPDSLGPKVIEDLLVTRHAMTGGQNILGEGFRAVCAISPGVLGTTGIETGEIISALVNRVKPVLVIVIDALAARRLERLHTTIQVADSGISPGSGVGNNRLGINRQTIGVPVVAIGVPTVVDASTIASEAFDALAEHFKKDARGLALTNALKDFDWDRRRLLITEVLEPYAGGRLMVTPKDTDTFIEDMGYIISGALNSALHPRVHSESSEKYLQ
ncbi:MAG TPA: GPR endopeptidase [Bacillota bacterium]|nr:GPR endopeptidase [Bacillota bacterium]HPZ10862.1 GPR endopeptidase [Bacillota bacterium]HQE09028.1 GPR endopeptidase [Bacillota bacterium]